MSRRRYRTRRPFVQAGCAGLHPSMYCAHGPSVPHTRCEIWGPHQAMTRQDARRIADGGLSSRTPEADRRAIAAYMATWGECLWHAASKVWGAPRCSCASCANPDDPRHPWRIAEAA